MENLQIEKTQEDKTLTVVLNGRLDTNSSPSLDEALVLGNVEKLILDIGNLVYVSSAGLRVILNAQKTMNKQGSMVLRNVKPEIMDIFEMTGFDSILTFE